MPSQLPYCIQMAQALGPIFIAGAVGIFAAVIAYRQWRTAHDALKFNLFEKRLSIYTAIKALNREIAVKGKVGLDDLYALNDKIDGFEFLFGEDVRSLIDQLRSNVWKAANSRHRLKRALTESPSSSNAAYQDEQAALDLIREQGAQLEQMFSRYLNLAKVHS